MKGSPPRVAVLRRPFIPGILKSPQESLRTRRRVHRRDALKSFLHRRSILNTSPCVPRVDINFDEAEDMVSGAPISDVLYNMYSEFQSAYSGCSGSACGNWISTTQDVASVRPDAEYLIVASRQGYYTAYIVIYVDADGASVSFKMVEEMSTNQDRVVLSWDYGQDLDLWVYDKADRSNKVGWNVAGRSDSFAGGQITLDVDNWDGMEGPETTQFRNLASGTVEVWVNHYDDTFTQSLVESTPATVDIFCYRCLDDDNNVKVGFVRSVTQATGDVPSGGRNWWKVGEFVAPGGSERVKWTTCVYNCYVDAATADLATSTGAPPVEVSMEAADMVTGSTISGVTYSVYYAYPEDYMGCSGSACGRSVTSVSDASSASIPGSDDGRYVLICGESQRLLHCLPARLRGRLWGQRVFRNGGGDEHQPGPCGAVVGLRPGPGPVGV